VKASKKLQKQFADFKAEFVHLCKAFGGERNERGEHTGGENSAFIIPCLWGNLHASIGLPWNSIDGTMSDGWRKYSSEGVFLQFHDNSGDCPFLLHGEFNQFSHKWNIHRSSDGGGMYVECCNAALTEFSKRLEKATGKTEAQASAPTISSLTPGAKMVLRNNQFNCTNPTEFVAHDRTGLNRAIGYFRTITPWGFGNEFAIWQFEIDMGIYAVERRVTA
jgi:hypothetical protein